MERERTQSIEPSGIELVLPNIDPRFVPVVEQMAKLHEVDPRLIAFFDKMTNDNPILEKTVDEALKRLKHGGGDNLAEALAEKANQIFWQLEKEGWSGAYNNRMSAIFAALLLLLEQEQDIFNR